MTKCYFAISLQNRFEVWAGQNAPLISLPAEHTMYNYTKNVAGRLKERSFLKKIKIGWINNKVE